MNDNSKRYTMLKLFITLIVFVILFVSIFHIDTIKAASKDDAADSSIISSDIISDEPVTNNPVLLGDTKLTNSDIYEIPADITSEWGENLKCTVEFVEVPRFEATGESTGGNCAIPTLIFDSVDGKSDAKITQPDNVSEYIKNLESNDPECSEWIIKNRPNELDDLGDILRVDFSKNKIVVDSQSCGLFYGCENLRSMNLENLGLSSNCKSTANMFKDCKNLSYIKFNPDNDSSLAKFDTSQVTDMSGMFNNCHSLRAINFPKAFNTSNVTTMQDMFNGCVSLCDISFGTSKSQDKMDGFRTENVKNMRAMFKNCRHIGRNHEVGGGDDAGTRLQSFMLSQHFTVENCTDLSEMFYCDNETAIEYDNHGNHVGQAKLEHTSWLKEIVTWDGKAFVFDAPNATTTKDMFCGLESLGGYSGVDSAGKLPVVITSDSLTNCSGMFKNCANMGAKVNDISTPIDVSNIQTSNVEDFSSMFEGCKSMKKVKGFNKLNSVKAKDFSSMFKDCIDLETFSGEYGPGESFFTSNVESMSSMFEGCFALKDANTHWFSGENLKDMSRMFKGCGNLKNVDLVSLTAPKLEFMDETFMNTSLAKEIILTNLNPENLKSMNRVFAGTWGLNRLDISKLKNNNVADENKQDMFMYYAYEDKKAPIDIDEWIKLGKDFSFKTNPEKDDLPFYVNRYVTKEDGVVNRWEDKPIACNKYSDGKDLDKNLSSMKGDDIAGTWKPARVLVVKDMIAKDNGGFEEHYLVSPNDTADTQLGTDAKIVANIDIQKKANKPSTDDKLTYPCHENFSVDSNNKWHNTFKYDEFDDPTNANAAQKVLYASPNWKCDVQVLDSDNTELANFPLFYLWPASYWPTWDQGAVPTNVLNYQLALEGKGQPGVLVHPGKTFKGWKIVGHGDKVYQWDCEMPKISELVKPEGKPEKIVLQAVYDEVYVPVTDMTISDDLAMRIVFSVTACCFGYGITKKHMC